MQYQQSSTTTTTTTNMMGGGMMGQQPMMMQPGMQPMQPMGMQQPGMMPMQQPGMMPGQQPMMGQPGMGMQPQMQQPMSGQMSPQADQDKPTVQDYEGEADHGPDLESNSGRNGLIGCCCCCCCVIVIGVVVGLAMGAIIAYLYLNPLSIKLDKDNIDNVAAKFQWPSDYDSSLEDSWGWGFSCMGQVMPNTLTPFQSKYYDKNAGMTAQEHCLVFAIDFYTKSANYPAKKWMTDYNKAEYKKLEASAKKQGRRFLASTAGQYNDPKAQKMCCMLNEAKGFDGQPVNVLQMYYGPRVAMTGVTRSMMVPSYNELFAEQHPKHSPRIEQILALGGDWKKSVKGMNLGYKCDSTYAIGTGKQSYIDGPGYQAWAARQGLRRSLASTAKVQAAANLPWVPLTGFCVTAQNQNVVHYANPAAVTAAQCQQYCQYDTGCSGFEFFAQAQNFQLRPTLQAGGKYNWGYATVQTPGQAGYTINPAVCFLSKGAQGVKVTQANPTVPQYGAAPVPQCYIKPTAKDPRLNNTAQKRGPPLPLLDAQACRNWCYENEYGVGFRRQLKRTNSSSSRTKTYKRRSQAITKTQPRCCQYSPTEGRESCSFHNLNGNSAYTGQLMNNVWVA